ncbi:MAG: hypothetical protein Tp118SUR00d2C21406351_12 [Prokaryotic dsDNA virus sp.]|nr:MAG: hypothetical protein Tp118SUR00d2C21406351_12 [Prokaryotic dsDNA virus sp.]|tara:strand:- start:669 stop:923 length:255 start_codon:yes stop_codon:yes gene_type:complete
MKIQILSISTEHYPLVKVKLPIVVEAVQSHGYYMVDASELEKNGASLPSDCYEVVFSQDEVSVIPTNVKIGNEVTVKTNHHPWR